MSYERHFSTDWDSLTRDEAMVRAYALGVAEALGDEYPGEYERLLAADKRALVEMAYNEGKRKALHLESEIEAESEDTDEQAEREYRVWNRLLAYHEPDADDEPEPASSRPRSRIDLPATLERIDVFDLPGDDLERLGLPDFLYR
jgi:hypothetical protein